MKHTNYFNNGSKKTERSYFVIQKSIGVLSILIGVTTTCLLKEGTVALFLVPLGIYLLVTKDHAITI